MMSEHEARRTPEGTADWNRESLGRALDATPRQAHHVGWGDGDVYRVGQDAERPTMLVVFPAAGVARFTTRQAEITLFRQQPPLRYEEQVRFEQLNGDERLQLTLTRRGRLSLHSAPGAVEPAAMPVPVASDTNLHPGEETRFLDDPAAPETRLTTPADDLEVEAGPEQDRGRLVGRLGAAPRFRTTRNDVLIATFPLAVRQDDDTTTWHTIRAFRERAATLQDVNLRKGQIAEVVG
jgi:hypothetical protein